jgi:hypothetical protein
MRVPLTLDAYMADDLRRWKRQSVYAQDDDYFFCQRDDEG